jgi:LysM repeat protein
MTIRSRYLCFAWIGVALASLGFQNLRGQDVLAQRAAAAADHEAAEERYKQMTSDIQSLLTAQEIQQKRLQALAEELRKTRDDQAHSGRNLATRDEVKEQLRELVEKIQEIDRKREADKKLILEELAKLGKTLQTPAPAPRKNREAERAEPSDRDDASTKAKPPKKPVQQVEGYPHEVQKGEYLSLIIAAYNAQYKKDGKKTITMKQVLDANPDLKPEKIQPGMKILIPDPGK